MKLTYGMVEFLQDLLINKDKEIEIDPNEVLDKIENAFESLDLAEVFATSTDHNAQVETLTFGEIVLATIDAPTVFVYGPFAPPVAPKFEAQYDGSPYS